MEDGSFGALVRHRRRLLDLTQGQLADRVGCALATIRKIESNERRPSQEVARLLADALAVPPAERPAFVNLARLGRPEPEPPAPLLASAPAPPAPPDPPALPALPAPPARPAAALLGREAELAAIGGLLANPICRLITLVGPGGIGKTRLAEAAAAAHGPAYRDGARMIALASVARPELLASTIAAALDVPMRGQSDAAERLVDALRERQLLLVLDNLEHLADGALLLGDILAAAPGVQILATSRERLGLSHEWVLDLRGLALPEGADDPEFERAGAARLFLHTARRLNGGFTLAPADRPVLLAICHLLDGMPLALELAAGWTRALSLAEIASEIGRGLDILTSSERDTPARHRSLRAVFDSSWERLDAAEQRALRRLAVFRGGFTRAAAEAVAGAGLPTLAALQSKSLLRRADGAARYTLHELVRQYAEERLRADQAEAAETRARHSAFALDLMRGQLPLLFGARRAEADVALRAEIDNIRAAWQWAAEGDDVGQIAACVDDMIEVVDHLDSYEEGLRLCRGLEERLRRLPPGDPQLDQARGLTLRGSGLFSFRLGRYDAARELLKAALALLRPGRALPLAKCLHSLGLVEARTGRYDAAGPPLAESYELYLALGYTWGATFALLVHSNALQALGAFAEARALLERSVELSRLSGDAAMAAYYQGYLANLLVATGERAAARALLDSLAELEPSPGLPADRTIVLGRCAYLLEDYPLARRLLERELPALRANNEAWVLTRNLTFLGQTLAALGDTAAAERYLLEALRLARPAALAPRLLEVLGGLAELRAHADPAGALPLLSALIAHPATWHETRGRAARLRAAIAAQGLPGAELVPPPDLDSLIAGVLAGAPARV